MIKRYLLGIAATVAVTAAPAAAQTFNFGTTPPSTATLLTKSAGGLSVAVTGYSYTAAPTTLNGANLNNTAVFTAGRRLAYSGAGVGVCTEGGANPSSGTISGNSGECPQADTNGSPNEALLLSFTGAGSISQSVDLLGAVLNIVDSDDTLSIFGVAASGALNFLGFNDSNGIANGGAGFSGTYSGANGGTYTATFTPALGSYSRYLFTARNDSADGYRLQSLTVSAVPELEIWAMLILGFGLVGLQMRRRSGLATVTA